GVDRYVGQVTVAVVDHQVQVDVVRLAKAAAGQRARDPYAADERGACHQGADEPLRHGDVVARVDAVSRGSVAYSLGLRHPLAVQDQVVDDGQIARSRGGPAHLGLGHRPAKAKLTEPGRPQGVASPAEQGDGTFDAVWRAHVQGGGIIQQRSASSRSGLVHEWIRPGVTLITPQPAPYWQEKR